jgi:predicted type IV restriction endonuclease
MAVGYLPPFQTAVGTYRRHKRRLARAAVTTGGRIATVAAGAVWVVAGWLAATAS